MNSKRTKPMKKPTLKLFFDSIHLIFFDQDFSNVNIAASIYPPLKRKTALKSLQNALFNGGVECRQNITQTKIIEYLLTLRQIFCISFGEKLEYLLNSSEFGPSQYK